MYTKIRYCGRLRDTSEIEVFADEVEDLCRSHNWPYHRWQEDWSKPNSLKMNLEDGVIHAEGHAPLKGISFNPGAGHEMIWLTCTPDGVLNSLFTLHDPAFTADDREYPWSRVKARLDDAKTYIAICNLFRFVAGKYFDDFRVMEETGYWKHGDEALLEKYLEQRVLRERQFEEELSAIQSDETMDPEKKDRIILDLIKQWGESARESEAEN